MRNQVNSVSSGEVYDIYSLDSVGGFLTFNVTKNSPPQGYTHPDDHSQCHDMNPGFKPFTMPF